MVFFFWLSGCMQKCVDSENTFKVDAVPLVLEVGAVLLVLEVCTAPVVV